ncbi:MAG: YdbL family protein [Gammaproteobacteria bacterium]|nr:YdbL family protein [Gammaproteobacteria bacterium]MCP5423503.1 YdbL family protein [Gammaproteobacteria bacterium]
MSRSVSRTFAWLLGCLGLLSACVTINIYFPAAAAEKAADQIIREVWQEQPDGHSAPPISPPDQGRRETPETNRLAWRNGLLDFVLPAAQAQANINIDTPAINQLKNSMAQRYRQLAPFYDNGAVGLTRDGLLAVRDLNAAPLNQRNALKQLVNQENKDRRALYTEIAKANGHPEWEGDIRATFARQWISNARSGWWYQGKSGWTQK